MQNKICSKCNIEKEISNFHKQLKGKFGVTSICKDCDKQYYLSNKNNILKINKKYPWKQTLKHIKTRCENSNHHSYKYYGGRGIKCLITEEELKILWFRDNASKMNKPSINRKDNDGHYVYDNCEFIEKSLNYCEMNKRTKSKIVCQHDLKGTLIKEWRSLNEIQRELKIFCSCVWNCCIGKTKSSYGFIWKYK